MPPLAAVLAVRDALQADRLLLRHRFANRALALGAPIRRPQQAADMIRAERWSQSALAPVCTASLLGQSGTNANIAAP